MLETLCLSASVSKQSLKSYVLCSGILYGRVYLSRGAVVFVVRTLQTGLAAKVSRVQIEEQNSYGAHKGPGLIHIQNHGKTPCQPLHLRHRPQ